MLDSFFVLKVVTVSRTPGDVTVKMTAHQGKMSKSVLAVNVHQLTSGALIAGSVFPVNGFVTEVMIAKMDKMKRTVPNDRAKMTNSSAIMESVFQTSWCAMVIETALEQKERTSFHNPVLSTVLPNLQGSFAIQPVIAFGTFTSVMVLMTVQMDRTSHENCAIDFE